MKTLSIDIGNTSTHYGLVEGRTVSETADFPTGGFRQGSADAFSREVAALAEAADRMAYCSVVPGANAALEQSLAGFGKTILHLTHETCRGLELVYPDPAEIGQDRIANAIAAQEYFGVPAVVIDMGTAVTFDIVSTKGYEGGIVAPGLNVMRTYLHEQTALLPELKEEDLVEVEGAIGRSTVHAMQLGVSVGFSGMIDALLQKVLAELRIRDEREPVVLSTGGSATSLTREWVGKSRFVQHLTLLGLDVAASRNML